MLDPSLVVEPGGQRYFELSKPLLSLSWPWRRPVRAGQMRATRLSVGSRDESDGPGAWTEPCQTPVLPAMKQVAAIRADLPMTGRARDLFLHPKKLTESFRAVGRSRTFRR